MKCEGAFFHWGCFSCSICDDKLEKGKKYGIIEGELFCEQHFIDASFELKKELERRELQQTGKILNQYDVLQQEPPSVAFQHPMQNTSHRFPSLRYKSVSIGQ